ncbi:TPA: hypothetical protein JBB55_15130, partial [Legionella pneumophila subsp. pneumophila]|nr:hypothetical protein [Legionella pneumophila subsp. pneumophila]
TSRAFANIPSKSQQHFYSSVLFTKMCVTAKTLLSVLPDREDGHWDYASAASLTRNIIECYLIFYYLCIDKISKSEWGCRWNIFNLHDCKARISLYEKLGIKNGIDKFQETVKDLENRLNKNKYFLSLPDKQQKEFLKGKKPLMVSQDDLVVKMGLNKNTFRGLYEFLSSQAHSFPLSFYKMKDDGRGRGVHCEVEENHTKVVIGYCIVFLEQAEKDMNVLFAQ